MRRKCSKRVFRSEIDAKIALYKARKSDSVVREKIPVRYYYCEDGCGGYHLTAMKEWKNVKNSKRNISEEATAYLRRQGAQAKEGAIA